LLTLEHDPFTSTTKELFDLWRTGVLFQHNVQRIDPTRLVEAKIAYLNKRPIPYIIEMAI
jgi:hypothetical protein